MSRHSSKTAQARNQRLWQVHVKAQEKSGLNRAEYCRQHKLSYHALTYWQRNYPEVHARKQSWYLYLFISFPKIMRKQKDPS